MTEPRFPDLLTIAQVAERLSCSRSTVRRLIKDGLPTVRVHERGVRVPETALNAIITRVAESYEDEASL